MEYPQRITFFVKCSTDFTDIHSYINCMTIAYDTYRFCTCSYDIHPSATKHAIVFVKGKGYFLLTHRLTRFCFWSQSSNTCVVRTLAFLHFESRFFIVNMVLVNVLHMYISFVLLVGFFMTTTNKTYVGDTSGNWIGTHFPRIVFSFY